MTTNTTAKPKCGAFLMSQPRGNYTPGARWCKRTVEHKGDHCHLHGGPK